MTRFRSSLCVGALALLPTTTAADPPCLVQRATVPWAAAPAEFIALDSPWHDPDLPFQHPDLRNVRILSYYAERGDCAADTIKLVNDQRVHDGDTVSVYFE